MKFTNFFKTSNLIDQPLVVANTTTKYESEFFQPASLCILFWPVGNSNKDAVIVPNALCGKTVRGVIEADMPKGSEYRIITYEEYLEWKNQKLNLNKGKSMKTNIYIHENVKDFRIGDIVYTKDHFYVTGIYDIMVGHITGLSLNCVNEVCFTVKFACEESDVVIHPANIQHF